MGSALLADADADTDADAEADAGDDADASDDAGDDADASAGANANAGAEADGAHPESDGPQTPDRTADSTTNSACDPRRWKTSRASPDPIMAAASLADHRSRNCTDHGMRTRTGRPSRCAGEKRYARTATSAASSKP